MPEHQRRQNGLNSAASHTGSPVENSPDDRNLSHGADVGPAKPSRSSRRSRVIRRSPFAPLVGDLVPSQSMPLSEAIHVDSGTVENVFDVCAQ